MIDPQVSRIVQALLYEGYILYPYRPSVKNQQRWTFGGLYPPDHAHIDSSGAGDRMQTECLVEGACPTVDLTLRWLHVVDRQVGKLLEPGQAFDAAASPGFEPVASLDVDGTLYHSWQEAVERTVEVPELDIGAVAAQPREIDFSFPAGRTFEPVSDASGRPAALIVRSHFGITGTIRLSAARLGDDLFRLTVALANCTEPGKSGDDPADPILRTLVSTHTILQATSGSFVSLLDPPSEQLSTAAEQCSNERTWPVLVGEPGDTRTLLSSPIILYDYPQLAPESPGDLFDGTEIDEILSLRIKTLSDDEKQLMRAVDARARALLQRTESLDAGQFAALHGTLRGLRPVHSQEKTR